MPGLKGGVGGARGDDGVVGNWAKRGKPLPMLFAARNPMEMKNTMLLYNLKLLSTKIMVMSWCQ